MRLACIALLAAVITWTPTLVAQSASPAKAMYLANAGVLVERGDFKILFDPLYRLNHGYYLAVPEHMENDLLVGAPPFDGVDAILISHFHLDHFSPNLLLNYLMINTGATLFAPEQAVMALLRFTTEEDSQLMDRVISLNLSTYGKPVVHELDGIRVETVRIPHSGWPDTNRGTQNLAYRVTLQGETTVLHLGDADAQMDLFDRFDEHWQQRTHNTVFAPYWFFLEGDGDKILENHLKPVETIGIHVPAEVPEEPSQRDIELRELNLFTRPGEFRSID